jgi:integrase
MPVIKEKAEVLDGIVFCYADRPETYFYRVYDKDTQKYRSKKVDGATSLDEACRRALAAHDYLRTKSSGNLPFVIKEDKKSDIPYSRLLDPLISQYLERERSRVDAGVITEGTYKSTYYAVGIHLREYVKSKRVLRTHEIKANFLDDYVLHRSECSKLTRNKELKSIQHFINWLLRNEYLHPKLASAKMTKTEKVTEEDLTANPAINGSDWEVITHQLREWRARGKEHTNPKTYYWRTLFWHFCLVMKNTGMRPVEIRHLQWKDIEFLPLTTEEEEARLAGRMSSSLTDKVAACYIFVKKSKTRAQREVPAKVGRELRRWKDFIVEHQRCCLTLDSYVFGNPDNEWRPYISCFFNEAWREVLSPIEKQLVGHKFSDKRYTIYSMRATYIEDTLMQPGGCDVFLLATICGHDVKILQKHYERVNVRDRADELIKIPYGKARGRREVETTTLL